MSNETYQEPDQQTLIERGDQVIFRVPRVSHPITINEVHATILGLSGLLFGAMYVEGFAEVVVPAAVGLISYAILGRPAFHSLPHDSEEYVKTIGMRTIRHEPWYFTAALLVSFCLGMAASHLFLDLDPEVIRLIADTIFELLVK